VQWAKLKLKIKSAPLWDLPIAPRWQHILKDDCTLIPDTPSPLALDRATLQQYLTSAILKQTSAPTEGTSGPPPELILHFPSPRKKWSHKRKSDLKRKMHITREPLRGSDASGTHVGISLVLERCPPRCVKIGKSSTYVEELPVQRDPEEITIQEAQQQQNQGIEITSIVSLDEKITTSDLHAATTLN